MIKKLLFGLCCLAVAFLVLSNYQEVDIRDSDFISQVEIKGEVIHPGVYAISEAMTIMDLIEKAGGCSDTADTSTLSLNRKIVHGDVIVVEKVSEKLISINSAPLEKLILIPGIGEKKAQLIIEYRTVHSFTVLEDLMNVKGIGEKSFEKMKPFICL